MGEGGHLRAGAEPMVFFFLVACSVLWWLYHDYTNDLSIALDTEWENMTCLLGFAIVSTVLTVRNVLPVGSQVASQNSEIQIIGF